MLCTATLLQTLKKVINCLSLSCLMTAPCSVFVVPVGASQTVKKVMNCLVFLFLVWWLHPTLCLFCLLQPHRRWRKWLKSTLTCWAPWLEELPTVPSGRGSWLSSAGQGALSSGSFGTAQIEPPNVTYFSTNTMPFALLWLSCNGPHWTPNVTSRQTPWTPLFYLKTNTLNPHSNSE